MALRIYYTIRGSDVDVCVYDNIKKRMHGSFNVTYSLMRTSNVDLEKIGERLGVPKGKRTVTNVSIPLGEAITRMNDETVLEIIEQERLRNMLSVKKQLDKICAGVVGRRIPWGNNPMMPRPWEK